MYMHISKNLIGKIGLGEVLKTFQSPNNWSRRACVRHPWWRTKRNWPLFSPTFGPDVRAPHGWRTKRSWPLFSPTFFFFFLFLSFSFSFFSAFYFSPTSGNLPCVKICFPQYFGITRRYMQKKKKF